MSKKTMGAFLVELRKDKELTQQQVAESLNVSNKTISKWERDEGYPEITMLREIAKFYEITTDELLQGYRNEEKELPEGIVYYEPEVDPKWARLDKNSLIAKTLSVSSLILFITICCFTGRIGMDIEVFFLPLAISTLSFAYLLYIIMEKRKFSEEVQLKNYNDLFFTFFFLGIELFTLISFNISENLGFLFTPNNLIFSGVFVSIIVTYLSHTILNRILKFSVITKEKRKLKSSFTWVSCLFTAVAIIVVIILSIYEINNIRPTQHVVKFNEMYYNETDAEYDYNRLKKMIFEGEPLYEITGYEGDKINLNEFVFWIEDGDNGYDKVEYSRIDTHLVFTTETRKQEFIKESVIETGKFDFLNIMDEDIVFNDEDLSITFLETFPMIEMAKRTSVVFSIIAMGITSALYGLLALIYYKKED